MLSSKFLKDVLDEAYPIIKRQLEDAEVIASFRELVTANGGDWSALKALMKAHVQDSLDDSGECKRVKKILEKADSSNAYAGLLGLANMNEKNYFEGEDDDVVVSDTIDSDGNRLKVTVDSRIAAILAKTPDPQPAPRAEPELDADTAMLGVEQPIEPVDPIRWEREPAVEPTRHPYSKAFGDFGQDHCVIQDDIEGAKSAPIVMLGDQILDGWARFNCARCTKTLTGETTQYPVMEYDGTDPLVDCIRWNMNGRLMSEAERANVAAILTKAEPKRKRDIYAAMELSMEQIA